MDGGNVEQPALVQARELLQSLAGNQQVLQFVSDAVVARRSATVAAQRASRDIAGLIGSEKVEQIQPEVFFDREALEDRLRGEFFNSVDKNRLPKFRGPARNHSVSIPLVGALRLTAALSGISMLSGTTRSNPLIPKGELGSISTRPLKAGEKAQWDRCVAAIGVVCDSMQTERNAIGELATEFGDRQFADRVVAAANFFTTENVRAGSPVTAIREALGLSEGGESLAD